MQCRFLEEQSKIKCMPILLQCVLSKLEVEKNKQRVYILCERERVKLREIKIRTGDEPMTMKISQRASEGIATQ